MDYLVDFAVRYGSTLASHCIVNDINFLATTAQHLQSDYVKDPWTAVAFPKHALKHPNWPIVNLVCTRLLPCVYSPKFKKAYEASKPALTKSGEFYSTNLESFTRFVRDDPNYTQSHSAAQDVLDLADFVKSMVAHDGPSVFNYGDQYVNWDPIGSFTPRPQDDEKVYVAEPVVKLMTQAQRGKINYELSVREVPQELREEIKRMGKGMTSQQAWHHVQALIKLPYKSVS